MSAARVTSARAFGRRRMAAGLAPEDRRELDHYEHLELLMNLAKAHARQLLAHEQ